MTISMTRLVTAFFVLASLALPALQPARGETPSPVLQTDGVIKVKSAYPLEETIARIKRDIAAKGIKFFDEIDQAKLGGDAGIKLCPSTLLIFGNPPLGIQFLTSNPNAGLDWPVRPRASRPRNEPLSAPGDHGGPQSDSGRHVRGLWNA